MKQIVTYEYQCTDFVFGVLFRCELMAVSWHTLHVLMLSTPCILAVNHFFYSN